MKHEHPVVATDVLEVLILPSITQASMLENAFYGTLKPYKEGLYLPGEVEPALVPEQQYFVVEGVGRLASYKQIHSLDNITTDVYNKFGVRVISGHALKNKDRVLSSAPTIPTRGIRLLKTIIDYRISEFSIWMNSTAYDRALRSHFAEELFDTIDIDTVTGVVQNTVSQLHLFMADHRWNHYFTRLHGFDIIVEKCADYRVCEWYEKTRSGTWK